MTLAIVLVTLAWIASLTLILALSRHSSSRQQRENRQTLRTVQSLLKQTLRTTHFQKTLLDSQTIDREILQSLLVTLSQNPGLSQEIKDNQNLRQALRAIAQEQAYQVGKRSQNRSEK